MANHFLGLDLSTQQLKAVIIDEQSTIVHESSVHFDRDLVNYATINGTLRGPDEGEVTSPVAMWVEAVDVLFERIQSVGFDFGTICAISGAGQQHGSVYWSQKAETMLKNLDPTLRLTDQLVPVAFSIDKAPIWQDSSTTAECMQLEEAIGGAQALADLTGSRAYERFTGSQIAKIRRRSPDAYAATARISLVSSFISSLFIGRIAPIEVSDASGMNLMDVITCKWNDKLLDLCGGSELRNKLGPEPIFGGEVLGNISEWWVKRWGFNTNCIIAPFTGDNPATVVSLSAPGDAILSLGTSTTFLLSIPPADTAPKRFTTSHLLSHPTTLNGQIAMLCYKNGALAREQIRDRFAGSDWNEFNKLVEATPVGCGGFMGFYFPLPEIIPPNVVGEFFYQTGEKLGSEQSVQTIPSSVHPRAILESQFLSIKSRIAAILPENAPPLQRLVISGGSSANQTIRQIAADIFNMKVFVCATKEAAGMGGALLAKYAHWKLSNPSGSLEKMTGGEVAGMQCVAEPRAEFGQVYEELTKIYSVCEEKLIRSIKV